MVSFRYIAVASAAALCFAASMLFAVIAGAAAPCAGSDIYIAAHQDDTLLFESPRLLEDVRSNRCVRTVFTTAGDSGNDASYWQGRETGAEAAYAQMAGVPNEWSTSILTLAGKPVRLRTLSGRPGISILFLRLPDGGIEGEGFAMYGNQSLKKLWNGGHAASPAIAEIEADDKSAKYKYGELLASLTAAIEGFGAHQIVTQNYESALEKGSNHSDHAATGRFVKAAAEALPAGFGGWRLTAFKDYEVTASPANVSGALLAAKEAAFYAYVPYDSGCVVDNQCTDPPYPEWLVRQYVQTSVTKGAVAVAGLEQSVGHSTTVQLNGEGSSREGGGTLTYSWTQVGGPPVTLSGPNTAKPTLTTPAHPTLLTFALTVSGGGNTSAQDFVRVRVPAASPNPVALVKPDQSVAAGASVTLDGSASYDPESLPLAYAWAQTAGPTVTLFDASSATPHFVAPDEPAASTVAFSLVVSNGAQASPAAVVHVAVAAGAPRTSPAAPTPPGGGADPSGPPSPTAAARLNRARVELHAGRRSRQLVRVTGGTAVRCRGHLPRGARCRVDRRGNVVLETQQFLQRIGRFRLTVLLSYGSESINRPLIVAIKK